MTRTATVSSKQLLDKVTILCADTANPSEAMWALKRCLSSLNFSKAKFLSLPQASKKINGLELVQIEKISNSNEYSKLVFHNLNPHIDTEFVLIVQWDGFIWNQAMWSDDFYNYDYIGAPWWGKEPLVGNGGFSLRSKKLLNALQKMDFIDGVPEDVLICAKYRKQLEDEYQIKFAPTSVAERFSFEMSQNKKDVTKSFGFHGMHNFAFTLSEQELIEWLHLANDSIFKTRHPRKLIRNLIRQRRTQAALSIIKRRVNVEGWSVDYIRFWLHAKIASGFSKLKWNT